MSILNNPLPAVGHDVSLFSVAPVTVTDGIISSVSGTPCSLLAYFKKMDLSLERVGTRVDAVKDDGEIYRMTKFKGSATASGVVAGDATADITTPASAWMDAFAAGSQGILQWNDAIGGGYYVMSVFIKGLKKAVSENATEDTLEMDIEGTVSYLPVYNGSNSSEASLINFE